jgi:hypothetical protein
MIAAFDAASRTGEDNLGHDDPFGQAMGPEQCVQGRFGLT